MTTLTPDEIEILAHEIRCELQRRSCCPAHAGEILQRVMVGFALDDAKDDAWEAASAIERTASSWAKRLRRGGFVMVREKQ